MTEIPDALEALVSSPGPPVRPMIPLPCGCVIEAREGDTRCPHYTVKYARLPEETPP